MIKAQREVHSLMQCHAATFHVIAGRETRIAKWQASIGVCLAGLALTSAAQAQPASPDPLVQLPAVEVNVPSITPIDRPDATASRLGLTPRETPATVDTVDAPTIQERGYQHVQDAVDSLPGVTSGGSPGDPVGLSVRGFTVNEVSVLRDGIYQGPASMVNRPQNAYNLQSVELLQGPGSVLYGQGAVGGALNVITKQPVFGPTTYDGLFSYGSFNTINTGVGVNTQVSDNVAVRLDVSRTSSNGYVHNDDPNSLNITGAVTWRATDTLTLRAGLDVLHDSLPSYYGTPLIPSSAAIRPLNGVVRGSGGLTIDAPTQFINYNTSDSYHKSTTYQPSLELTWQPSSVFVITDRAYIFYADRRWDNAESYTFLPAGSNAVDAAGMPIPANQIGRDRFFVNHQQHQYGDTLSTTFSTSIFGLPNRTVVGVDSYFIDFVRDSGFPNAQFADFVDPYSGFQGNTGTFLGESPQRHSPTYIADVGGFFEDQLSIRPNLKLVTGLRYDWFDLNRQNYSNSTFNTQTSFKATYHPDNYRIGLVYDVRPDLTLYGQYVTAQDPPGANIFLANAGQIVGLSGTRQEEIGAKSVFFHDRADATLALYHIERTNILVTTTNETVANVGGQHSSGIEFSTHAQVTPNWRVSANAAYTHSRFDTFFDPVTGLNASGNRPPDVPTYTAGLWTNHTQAFGYPLDLGASIQYVGDRAGNYTNSLRLDGYALASLYATYHVKPGFDLQSQITNLFNKIYAQWADVNYPTEVLLGAPRAVMVGLHVHL